MAANVGRKLFITKNGAEIAGCRNTSVTINGSPIDITSNDDQGFRTLMAEAGEKSMDISTDGITKDNVLRAIMLGGVTGQLLTDIVVNYPDGSTVAGDFFITTIGETAPYNDAITFNASFQSSGEWTFTPAP